MRRAGGFPAHSAPGLQTRAPTRRADNPAAAWSILLGAGNVWGSQELLGGIMPLTAFPSAAEPRDSDFGLCAVSVVVLEIWFGVLKRGACPGALQGWHRGILHNHSTPIPYPTPQPSTGFPRPQRARPHLTPAAPHPAGCSKSPLAGGSCCHGGSARAGSPRQQQSG